MSGCNHVLELPFVAGRLWRRLRWPQLALIVLLAVLAVGYSINALRDPGTSPRSATTVSAPTAANGEIALSSLPAQAATTVGLIEKGGPFPYRQDGVVFNNAERLLPAQPRGFYHEYTVPTPGSPDRGARRIITGQDGSYYYTANHYESFVRVDVSQ